MPFITPKLSKTSRSGAALRATASKNVAAKPVAGNASTVIRNPSLVDYRMKLSGTVGLGVSPLYGEPILQIRMVSSVAGDDPRDKATANAIQAAFAVNRGGLSCGAAIARMLLESMFTTARDTIAAKV